MIKRGFLVCLIFVTMLNAGCSQLSTAQTSQSEPLTDLSISSRNSENNPAADPVDAYLLVIDDLFNQDPALNSNIEYLAINCSTMVNLSAEGRTRMLNELKKYGFIVLDNTMDQLKSEGYVRDLKFENGIFIEIKDQQMKASTIVMSAMKWRGGLAAFGWENRTVTWKNNSWTLDESKETWVS